METIGLRIPERATKGEQTSLRKTFTEPTIVWEVEKFKIRIKKIVPPSPLKEMWENQLSLWPF